MCEYFEFFQYVPLGDTSWMEGVCVVLSMWILIEYIQQLALIWKNGS